MPKRFFFIGRWDALSRRWCRIDGRSTTFAGTADLVRPLQCLAPGAVLHCGIVECRDDPEVIAAHFRALAPPFGEGGVTEVFRLDGVPVVH